MHEHHYLGGGGYAMTAAQTLATAISTYRSSPTSEAADALAAAAEGAVVALLEMDDALSRAMFTGRSGGGSVAKMPAAKPVEIRAGVLLHLKRWIQAAAPVLGNRTFPWGAEDHDVAYVLAAINQALTP